MSRIQKELEQFGVVEAESHFFGRQDFLDNVLYNMQDRSIVTDAKWKKLSKEARTWYNHCVDVLNKDANADIPEFPDYGEKITVIKEGVKLENKNTLINYLAQAKQVDGIEIIKVNSQVLKNTDKVIIVNLGTNTVSLRFKADEKDYGCTEITLVALLQEVYKVKEREQHSGTNMEILDQLEQLEMLMEVSLASQKD